MTTVLAILLCVAAATIGGLYFAFSTAVMKALASCPTDQGAAIMQRINVVILNPLFLGVFFGTALLSVASIGSAFLPWQSWRSILLLASGGLYLLASFGVTIVFNVPRNERLARVAAESAQAATYWPVYLREWTRWNHVRALSSVASALCAAGALAI